MIRMTSSVSIRVSERRAAEGRPNPLPSTASGFAISVSPRNGRHPPDYLLPCARSLPFHRSAHIVLIRLNRNFDNVPRRLLPVLLLFVFLSHRPVAAQPEVLDGLGAYIEAAMEDWEVPGLAIAVVKDDDVVYARGFGVRELGGSEPVDEHTMFAIASTTKAFTAAALGMLVDDGKLDWDDAVRRHMPAFELSDPYVTREVTVRDLLTHRTGLAGHNNVWIASPFDRAEIVRRTRFLSQARPFRSGYGYNNIMYIAAGELVEAISGQLWDDFLQTRVFDPLDMTRTTTRSAVVDMKANVTSSHTQVDGDITPLYRRNYDALGGAGSMFSTVHDMAQWVRLHLANGKFEGMRLLEESTVEEMHEPQVVIGVGSADRRLFSDREFSAYGLGWRVHNYRGRKVVQHTGWVNYTRTQVGMIPSENIGMVAFSNATSSSLHTALMYHVFDALLGYSGTDWSERFLEHSEGSDNDDSGPTRVAGTEPSLATDQYVGLYTDSLYGDIRVEVEDDGLVLRYSDEYVADLEHWHFDTYRATWRPAGFGRTFATFDLDHRGRIESLDLRGFTTFGRQED